ncbi:MAG TPA: hypothetical protein VFB60_15435 [Ktedonobacteraceae bacterium]|nr:hypothetical protein [Ktedonobacteraceae bacterium]
MGTFLNWWYGVSLPNRGPDTTPMERERTRYARLTSAFTLLLLVTFLPLGPIMFFDSPNSPSSPPLAVALLCMLLGSLMLGRWGHHILAATCVVLYVILGVTGPLVTNPLDPTLLPLFGLFSIAIILAGALMPPLAALIVGAGSCVEIVLISVFLPHTDAYEQMLKRGLFTITLMLPITIQVIVAVIIYAIMRNWILTIRRADRAEEIIALQKEIADYQRGHSVEREQLEEGFYKIADTYTRIANGDFQARVSLSEGNVLWSIALPLNNLLNRLQYLKNDVDTLVYTRNAARQVAESLRYAIASGRPMLLQPTGTPLDPVLVEINKIVGTQSFARMVSTFDRSLDR